MLLTLAYCLVTLSLLLLSDGASSLEQQDLASPEIFKSDVELDISLRRCKHEKVLLAREHKAWLNRLDRKRVVFVGDSLTRCAQVFLSLGSLHKLRAHDLAKSSSSFEGYELAITCCL